MKNIKLEKGYMMNKEELKKLKDHKFYLENFCKVKTKNAGLQPFKLKEAQKDIFNEMKKHKRIIILKARQLGFSTAITGFFYVDTIMNPGVTTALIGYNSDMVTELLDKVKTFYRTTPDELKPTIQYDSKYQMSFPKMDSKILVLPNTKDVGRGYTIHNCLITELSSWEDADEKVAGLLESIPKTGRVVIESTPRGQGNLYHRLWMTDNEFVKKKYGWWWEYSQEEMNEKMKSEGKQYWAQEYGLEFLASGRNVFDQEMLRKKRRHILEVGQKNEPLAENQETTIVRQEEGWIVYRDPSPGKTYVVGADVAEGVEGGNYSVAIIWDRETGEEVAMYRGLLPPDIFGEELDKWGRKYNNALMVVESNNHGLTTLTTLKNLVYPNMYFRKENFDSITNTPSTKLGWKTTYLNRRLLMDELAKAMREESLIPRSKKLLDEMSVFVFDDKGDMKAQAGFNDDCIFAAAVGLQGFKQIYHGELPQIDERKHLPQSFPY